MNENPFAKADRERDERWKLYGIEDLHYLDRGIIYMEICRRVSGVTDEQEIRNISAEVRQQYFEYKQQKDSEAQQ